MTRWMYRAPRPRFFVRFFLSPVVPRQNTNFLVLVLHINATTPVYEYYACYADNNVPGYYSLMHILLELLLFTKYTKRTRVPGTWYIIHLMYCCIMRKNTSTMVNTPEYVPGTC